MLPHIVVTSAELSSEISFNLSEAEHTSNHIKLRLGGLCVCVAGGGNSKLNAKPVGYSFYVGSVICVV